MIKRILILILISSFFQKITAQEVEDEKELKMLIEILYDINSEFLKFKKRNFKTVEYNPKDYFKKPFTIEEADSYFTQIKETSKIEIKENTFYFVTNILLSPNNNDFSTSLIKINIFENKLLYNKDSLILRKEASVGNQSNNHCEISINCLLETEQTDITKVTGSITMEVKFIVGYDLVTLKNDALKNKKIQIGNDTIEIIDILDDKVVLRGNNENTKLINFVKDNKVAVPLTFDDKDFNPDEAFHFVSTTMGITNYQNFIEKNISKEEFMKLVTMDNIKELEKEEKYLILKDVTKIGKQIILYKPIFKTYYLTVEN